MKSKVLIITAITALCSIFGAVGVFAGSNVEQIQALINNSITFSVNNVEWTAKDDDGSVLNPIIYNGHTYLPVRAVGQAMGADVVWDDTAQKVKITTAASVTDATYGTPYKDVNPDSKSNKLDKNKGKFDKGCFKHGNHGDNNGDNNNEDNFDFKKCMKNFGNE